LTGYLAVVAEPLAHGRTRFHNITVVKYHRWTGPLYFKVIRPFHHLVVRSMVTGYGARTAYRFDFADQHVLARTLGVEKVATRVCFDPAVATRLLALAKRAGVFRALRGLLRQDALVALLSRLRAGSDGFAVKVEVEGKEGDRYSCLAWGRGEGRATGVVAALVAEKLHASPLQRGVFHAEQLFNPLEVFAGIMEHGIAIITKRADKPRQQREVSDASNSSTSRQSM
jgi:hypothetical protein